MARHFEPDDRHNITNPYDDPGRWAESLKKTRVNDLFKTKGGLDGHVKQLEQEIKRVVSKKNIGNQMEDMSGEDVGKMMTAVETIKSAIVSAGKAATFDFDKFGMDFGFGSSLYLEKKDGKLLRDGREA